MSSSERNTETEQNFKNLVPVEGCPGLFTYKDVDMPDKEEMDRILANRRMEIPIEDVKKSAEEVDLSGMKLVPLEDHPGLFTYEPINSE